MNRCCMLHSSHHSLHGFFVNCNSSPTSVLGVSKRVRIFFHVNLVMMWPFIDTIDFASIYFMK